MKGTTQTTYNGMLVHESRGGVESFFFQVPLVASRRGATHH
jgi:hypothetical protein